jgi:hypothetical protein
VNKERKRRREIRGRAEEKRGNEKRDDMGRTAKNNERF